MRLLVLYFLTFRLLPVVLPYKCIEVNTGQLLMPVTRTIHRSSSCTSLALPAPQFVINQNNDGSWNVVDNENADFTQTFPTEEEAQFEATTRNDQILNNQVPAGFNPDSVSSRQSFLQEQIDRMEAYDANKRQSDEKYTGDIRVRNTIAFFEWLKKADAMLAAFEQKYPKVAQRNSERAINELADIKERIELTKLLMAPIRVTKLPNMVFQGRGGKTFRVVMDKNNRPLRPKDKKGNPKNEPCFNF